MYIHNDIWFNILKFLDLEDLISVCQANKHVYDLCEKYPNYIYKEILKQKGFTNFEKFNIDVFLNFSKLDAKLNLTIANVIYAYEHRLGNVLVFLLDNFKITRYSEELTQKELAENIHQCWMYYFRDTGYDTITITERQKLLLLELIRFNVVESKDVNIPKEMPKNYIPYIYNKLYSKIELQSMGSLFFHIAIMKNDWDYVLNTIDIIGMEYYEDAY
jgi:hypothetical protein